MKKGNKESPEYQELYRKLERAIERKRPYVADVELTLAFLSGNQWVKASESRGVVPVENAANERRVTDNRMLPAFVRWMYYLFQEDPVITCFGGGQELRDSERARVAASLCDYWEINNGWRDARQEQVGWAGTGGVGYIAPIWQARHHRKTTTKLEYSEDAIERDDGTVSFLKEEQLSEWEGDIAFRAYSPLQVHAFPLNAPTWQKVNGVLIVDLVSFEWLEQNLPIGNLKEAELQAVRAEEINLAAMERTNAFVSSAFGYMNEAREEKQYLVLQWLERPSVKRADGRYLVTVGGKVLVDEDLPFVVEAREIDPGDNKNISMGIIPMFALRVPGRMIPPSPMGELRAPQIRLNEILTDQDTNRRMVGRNKLLYEEGTIDDNAWTDEHGEKIAVKPGSAIKPQWVQAPPLVGIEHEKAGVLESFEEASGQLDVLRGSNPSNVRAAFQLDILREEAMKRVYAAVEMLEQSYELCARLCLSIARRRYTPARIVQIYGQDYAGHALSFKSATINTDIRIKTGSMRPRNGALVEAKLVELMQFGAFKDNIDLFWRMSQLGTLNKAVDHEEKIKLWARSENVRMLVFEKLVMPFEHEDHDLHITEHLGFMSRPEWYAAPERVQEMFLAHIDHHRDLRTAQLAPEAVIDQDPVAGLGADGGSGAAPGAAASLQSPPMGEVA